MKKTDLKILNQRQNPRKIKYQHSCQLRCLCWSTVIVMTLEHTGPHPLQSSTFPESSQPFHKFTILETLGEDNSVAEESDLPVEAGL